MSTKKNTKAAEAIKRGMFEIIGEVYQDIKKEIPAFVKKFRTVAMRKLIEAQKRLLGETMIILGPPAAGKTTLLRVLQNPLISGKDLASYRKTELDEIEAFKCTWKLDVGGEEQIEFAFKVRKTSDVGGESYVRENHWGGAINGAKILVYVFDAKTFLDDLDGSYKARIKEDFDWLLVNSQRPKTNFALLLVANKTDLLCDRYSYEAFERDQKKQFECFVDELRASWKIGFRKNIKGVTLLSLTDDILRQFTLDNLVLGFVGEELRSLFIKSKMDTE